MKNSYDKNNRTENYTNLATYTPYINTLVTSTVKVVSCDPKPINMGPPILDPYSSLSIQNTSYICPYSTLHQLETRSSHPCKIPDIYEGITVKLF